MRGADLHDSFVSGDGFGSDFDLEARLLLHAHEADLPKRNPASEIATGEIT